MASVVLKALAGIAHIRTTLLACAMRPPMRLADGHTCASKEAPPSACVGKLSVGTGSERKGGSREGEEWVGSGQRGSRESRTGERGVDSGSISFDQDFTPVPSPVSHNLLGSVPAKRLEQL